MEQYLYNIKYNKTANYSSNIISGEIVTTVEVRKISYFPNSRPDYRLNFRPNYSVNIRPDYNLVFRQDYSPD